MSGTLVLLLVVLGVAAGVASRPRGSSGGTPGPRLVTVRARTRTWRWLGVVAGLGLAGAAVLLDDQLGRGWMLAAPLFALGVLAGAIVGELRVTAPAEPTRRVDLEVRRLRDYVPRTLGLTTLGATVLLGLVLTVTTALGSPDDLGHAGRRLVLRCSAVLSEGRGPWPGSFYSLPLLAVVGTGLVATALAIHLVVRRPRQGEDVAFDDALRCQAARSVTAATGLLVAIPLAGVSLFAGIALLGMSCPPWWFTTLGAGLLVLVPASLVLAGWCATALVLPHDARTRVGGVPR